MVAPERRTRGDVLAALAIVVVVAVGAGLIWWTSDARATVSRVAAAPLPPLRTATEVPSALRESWHAASPSTGRPIVVGGAVITGDGHVVTGREPATGAARWIYSRDADLCGVTSMYSDAVAVYPDDRGCGQVTALDGRTGRRHYGRSSYADRDVTLSTDGSAVLSAGDSRLELWRSDLVRMLSWGALDARLKPGVPAQPLCRIVSAAASASAVSLEQACPGQRDLRLALLKPGDDEDEPNVRYVPQPGLSVDADARVIAVAGTTTAVYVPAPRPAIDVIDENGTLLAALPLPGPASPAAAGSSAGNLFTWWTGSAVLVFDAEGLRYRYTVAPVGDRTPVGPAAIMAGKLLVPVSTGYDVLDSATGAALRTIPVLRAPGSVAVVPAVAGSVLLEQRGPELVALGG